MFHYLKLMAHKALNEEFLRDLGKINIICGRNSSGKSTLMEAVGSIEKRRFGKKLTSEDIEQIYQSSSKHMAWREDNRAVNGVQRAQLNSTAAQYRAILDQAAEFKEIWFSDDAPVFLNQFRLHWEADSAFFGHFDTPEGEVLDAFKKSFHDDIPTVLVPAKRRVELSSALSFSGAIGSDGQGLLSQLFFIKNQADGTEERQTYDRMAAAFSLITGGHRFDIFPTPENTLNLNFAFEDATWRPAQDCGLGLQDLLVLLYFAVTPTYQVVLIEEPESHLHPEWQRKLLVFFRKESGKQFFLTTHSNIFLDAGLVDKVFFTTLHGSITVDDATRRAGILADLGYSVSDNLVSDLIILVEGPSDLQVIEETLIKMGLYSRFNIKIWSLGGDNMAQLDLTVFAEQYTIMALIDNDPKSGHVRQAFIKKCAELQIPVTRLRRYALENYFPLRAMREVYKKWGTRISDDVTTIEPDKPLDVQIGINVKRNNREIAREMTLSEIQATDDLNDFLSDVERRLRSG